MTQNKKFTFEDLSKEIDQRLNRLSGGASILALRELLEDGKNAEEHQVDRLLSVQSEIVKIKQPTLGRANIVKDIISLIDDYRISVTGKVDDFTETANAKLKTAKLSYDAKIASGEIVDKTTKDDDEKLIDILSKGLTDSTDIDREFTEQQTSVEDVKSETIEVDTIVTSVISAEILVEQPIVQTSKSFTGKKTKLTKAFLSKHKELSDFISGDVVYIDNSVVTAYIASEHIVSTSTNLNEHEIGSVVILDEGIVLA